jgi:hypothetical protein
MIPIHRVPHRGRPGRRPRGNQRRVREPEA